MIREILIYLCTFVCVVSAGVVYWGMESNLKILSEIKKVLEAWAEGGGEVLDERYFCVCGEPVYSGEISCLKCGTPRPAYTRHQSKSEGGADELISPKGIVTSKKAYERFHAEGDADGR